MNLVGLVVERAVEQSASTFITRECCISGWRTFPA